MIHIFDNITRKYIGSRQLPIQEGEDLLYSENEIIGTTDGLFLDENGNYFYEEIETIEEKKAKAYERIDELYTSMWISSLSRATGKPNSKDDFRAIREEYKIKFDTSTEHLANLTISNPKMLIELGKECERDFAGAILDGTIDYLGLDNSGTRLDKFCRLVVYKYNYGENIWKYLQTLCSKFRTTCITDIDNSDFIRFEERYAIAKTITNETTIEQIEALELTFENV